MKYKQNKKEIIYSHCLLVFSNEQKSPRTDVRPFLTENQVVYNIVINLTQSEAVGVRHNAATFLTMKQTC